MDRVYSMIQELRDTSSIVDKKQILKKYMEHREVPEVLKLAYDPYLNSYVSDTSLYERIVGEGPIYSVYISIREFQELFMKLHNREITGNEAKEEIVSFLSKCTSEVRHVYIRTLARDLKCGIAAKTINAVFGKLVPEFNVQLASTYDTSTYYDNSIWYASPKMDGVRGVFKNGVFLSRKGRSFVGIEHIEEELRELSEKISADIIDGEIYIPGKNFPQIYSLISGDYDLKAKSELKFYAFLATNSQTSSTVEMLRKLDELNAIKPKFIVPVPYTRIRNDVEAIIEQTKDYVSCGYEGSVLRHPNVFYSEKRDKNLVKFKFFNEADVIITGILEGDGKYSGSVGSLSYTGKIGNVTIEGEVGSGLSDYDRAVIANKPGDFIGRKMTVKFQEMTPISNNTASLRFPVILGFKEDR